MIILDTHIWLWWLLGDGNLSAKERGALDLKASHRELTVSWVSKHLGDGNAGTKRQN